MKSQKKKKTMKSTKNFLSLPRLSFQLSNEFPLADIA